jgi:hypothetical protein
MVQGLDHEPLPVLPRTAEDLQITNSCDRLESGDHLDALSAGQCTDHGRLTVTLNGQAHRNYSGIVWVAGWT